MFFSRLNLPLVALLGLLLNTGVTAEPLPVVVCYPGGPVSESDANQAMGAMLRVLERTGGWPEGHFTSSFSSDASACEQLLSAQSPPYAITSLGLFLTQQHALNLIPLAQPRMRGKTSEEFHLVAAQGRFKGLDAVRGARVGGTVFEEQDFIQRIVFEGHLDPRKDFALNPSHQAIRALRALDRGELDAVLLNGQQYAALNALPLNTPLESVYTSPAVPLMGLAANSQKTTTEDRARMQKGLTALCSDAEGKKLCELFGIEAFVAADQAAIQAALNLWKKMP